MKVTIPRLWRLHIQRLFVDIILPSHYLINPRIHTLSAGADWSYVVPLALF